MAYSVNLGMDEMINWDIENMDNKDFEDFFVLTESLKHKIISKDIQNDIKKITSKYIQNALKNYHLELDKEKNKITFIVQELCTDLELISENIRNNHNDLGKYFEDNKIKITQKIETQKQQYFNCLKEYYNTVFHKNIDDFKTDCITLKKVIEKHLTNEIQCYNINQEIQNQNKTLLMKNNQQNNIIENMGKYVDEQTKMIKNFENKINSTITEIENTINIKNEKQNICEKKLEIINTIFLEKYKENKTNFDNITNSLTTIVNKGILHKTIIDNLSNKCKELYSNNKILNNKLIEFENKINIQETKIKKGKTKNDKTMLTFADKYDKLFLNNQILLEKINSLENIIKDNNNTLLIENKKMEKEIIFLKNKKKSRGNIGRGNKKNK